MIDASTFELIYAPFAEPMLLLSPVGEVLATNAAVLRAGLFERHALSRKIENHVHLSASELHDYLSRCARSREFVPMTVKWSLPDGSATRYRCDGAVLTPSSPTESAQLLLRLRPHEQAAAGFAALNQKIDELTREITVRQRAEAELTAQREWLRVTLESIGDGVLATDAQRRVTFMNAVAETMTGWTMLNAGGRLADDVFVIVDEHTQLPVDDPIQKVLETDQAVTLANHTVLVAPDGTRRPIEDSAAPIRDAQGRVLGVVLVFRDVSNLKKSEARLRESEARFRRMADSAPVIIWQDDPLARRVYANNMWFEFTGRARTGAADDWHSAMHPDDRPAYTRAYTQCREHRRPFRHEYRLRRADGQYRHVLEHGVTLLADGEFLGYIGSCVDFTELREAREVLSQERDELERRVGERTEQLTAANLELQRINSELQQFTSVASHDLQEPLRTIASFTQILERRLGPTLSDVDKQHLAFIVDAAKRMRELIRDLLSYARSGGQPEQSQPVDLNEVTRQAVHGLHELVTEANASVAIKPLPTVPGQESQLFQLMQNLIGNALKFRAGDRPPQIMVEAEEAAAHWHITVRDNGIGFEHDYAERIFDIFFRLHGRGQYPGTGVGLAICRKIVELHGGRIWAESVLDQGSVFHFTLAKSPGQNSTQNHSEGERHTRPTSPAVRAG